MEAGEIIAFNLKRLRNEKNLTLGQLANMAGVSKVVLSQIEKGEANPTINTIRFKFGKRRFPRFRRTSTISFTIMRRPRIETLSCTRWKQSRAASTLPSGIPRTALSI